MCVHTCPYFTRLHVLIQVNPGVEETDATRAVHHRVEAPAAMGARGSNRALGIDVGDESAGVDVAPGGRI